MNKPLIAASLSLALTMTLSSATAYGADKAQYPEQNTGVGVGFVIGAIVGGPIGAVALGAVGNFVGGSIGQEQELVAVRGSLEHSKQDLQAAQQTLTQIQQQRQIAQQQIDGLKQQYAQSQMQYERQLAQLVQSTMLEGPLAVSLQFRTGSSELEPIYQQQLSELAKVMQSLRDHSLDLSGYADRQGDEKYNYQLSMQRAESVKQYLISQGVSAARIVTKAFGETQPLQATQTLQSDFFDRRVILKLAPTNDALVSR